MHLLLPIVCLLVIPLSVCAQGGVAVEERLAQDESRQRSEKLWEQSIAAKGGRERLQQVKSLAISYQAVWRNFLGVVVHRGLVEALYVFPDKSWSWDDGLPPPFHLTVSMFNLERRISCTMYAGASEPKCREPRNPDQYFNQSEGLARIQYLYLMETKWIKPVPVRATKGSLELQVVDVVQTDVNGKRVDYYLDRETHLPRRVVTFFPSGRVWETYDFRDYRSIAGIQMPGVQKKGKIDFQLNPSYDETIFTRPPSIKDGATAWQSSRP